ncbi:hypothetical protein DFS33DRAFT_1401567 [Desarmillaria ectypa]|nr:hypothetical protein DFS33DRAFT_1401567 [Desarmillaria ectypa]
MAMIQLSAVDLETDSQGSLDFWDQAHPNPEICVMISLALFVVMQRNTKSSTGYLGAMLKRNIGSNKHTTRRRGRQYAVRLKWCTSRYTNKIWWCLEDLPMTRPSLFKIRRQGKRHRQHTSCIMVGDGEANRTQAGADMGGKGGGERLASRGSGAAAHELEWMRLMGCARAPEANTVEKESLRGVEKALSGWSWMAMRENEHLSHSKSEQVKEKVGGTHQEPPPQDIGDVEIITLVSLHLMHCDSSDTSDGGAATVRRDWTLDGAVGGNWEQWPMEVPVESRPRSEVEQGQSSRKKA